MRKVAVIGDLNSIYGFAALGLEIFPADEKEEAAKKLKQLVLGKYAVIYITESLCEELYKEINLYQSQMVPAIIPIPGVKGKSSIGIDNVKKFVEKAIGSDILFGDG